MTGFKSQYTPEFREQVVKYVLDNRPSYDSGNVGRFMAEVAAKFKVDVSTVYSWMPGNTKRSTPHPGQRRRKGGRTEDALAKIDAKISQLQEMRALLVAVLNNETIIK